MITLYVMVLVCLGFALDAQRHEVYFYSLVKWFHIVPVPCGCVGCQCVGLICLRCVFSLKTYFPTGLANKLSQICLSSIHLTTTSHWMHTYLKTTRTSTTDPSGLEYSSKTINIVQDPNQYKPPFRSIVFEQGLYRSR